DQHDDVRAGRRIPAGAGAVLHARRVHLADTARRAPLDAVAEAGRAHRPGVPVGPVARRAPRQDQPPLAGRLPERHRVGPDRGLDQRGRHLDVRGGHSVASVPSTTVPIVESTPPEPWATATSAPSTCRGPHSPRSWRTASTSRNMPYIPGWV